MNNIQEYIDYILNLKAFSNVATTILYLVLGYMSTKLISKLIEKALLREYAQEKKMITIVKLLSSIIKYVVWFIVVVAILAIYNIDTTGIITSAGVLGLAIGFGAQDLVKDFISGFFIIFEQQFNVGDIIEVQGFKGTVTTLGLKTTHIKSWTGEVKIISNGSIDNVINFSMNNSIAVVDFSVDYTTNLDRFRSELDKELEGISKENNPLRSTPQLLGIQKLNDSGIDMRIICETAPHEHFGVERFLREFVKDFCDNNNYSIPYPQVVIHSDRKGV